MESIFRVVCAWCEQLLCEGKDPNARTSHSICDSCFSKEFASLQARRTESRRLKAIKRLKARKPVKPRSSVSLPR